MAPSRFLSASWNTDLVKTDNHRCLTVKSGRFLSRQVRETSDSYRLQEKVRLNVLTQYYIFLLYKYNIK